MGETLLRAGGLCFGVGGLEMGLARVLDAELTWYAETDPHAAAIAAHNWPGVPNVGDITTADWTSVEPVDALAAGFPCQPSSAAGKRRGMDDERWLWDAVARAVGVLRPRLVVVENVRGLLTVDRGRAFGRVLGDLASLGYDTEWTLLRAADAGAPHGRARMFLAAADTDDGAHDGERARSEPGSRGVSAADAGRVRGLPGRLAEAGEAARGRACGVVAGRGRAPVTHAARDARRLGYGDDRTAADASGDGRVEGRTEPAGFVGGPDAAQRGAAPAATGAGHVGEVVVDWGVYEPAIRRWERALGRSAPRPTEPGRNGRQRLSPAFVEWMQGLPAGHVTTVPGVPRNAQLAALGNGVVPQQAELALRELLPRLFGEAAAA